MKLLALIPARSGSKGVPNKNIRHFCGKPLIQWTIEAALNSSYISTVAVSTNSQQIAELSLSIGADVPFIRPEFLSSDVSPTLDTIFHALDYFPDCTDLLLLQPTSPLRTTVDIDTIIKLRSRFKASSAVSVTESSKHPEWSFQIDSSQVLTRIFASSGAHQRQQLAKVYYPNGALYLTTIGSLVTNKTLITKSTVAYVMPPERSVDIDTELDWLLAESILKKYEAPLE